MKNALLFILIGLNLSLFSQRRPQYNIENLSTEIYQLEKGITQNSVRFILEDHKGYMWFGTWDGLNRYDGTEFKYFTPSINKPNSSLVQQTVNTIIQDNNDNIWVGTDGGLSRIDYRTFAIKNYHLFSESKSDTIHAFYQDKEGLIWIGTQKGIVLLNPKSDSIFAFESLFKGSDLLIEQEIRLIKKFNDRVWIATAEGLFEVYILPQHQLKVKQIDGLSDLHITSLAAFGDSLLLIGTENGLNLLNLKSQSIKKYYADNKKYGLASNSIMALLNDGDFRVWIGTSGGGLNLFDLKLERFTTLRMNAQMQGHHIEESEMDSYIYSLCRSESGIIWVGTAWQGVMKINEKQNIFKAFKKSKQNPKGLIDNHIWSFASTDTSILIGTESGVSIYNFLNHQFTYLTTKNGLSSNQIRSIFIDSKDNFWIGTFNGGLNCYNSITGQNTIYCEQGDSVHNIRNNTVWTILEDKHKQIWFGTYNGLYCYDMVSGGMKSYFANELDSNALISNSVYCSILDSNGHIWFGTYNGLSEYNPATDQFISYQHILGDSLSLSMNRIFSIYDDQKGNLWIGTVGGGLNQFNKKTKKFKWFTKQDGLPNNVVYASIPDHHGNLWISTNYGICRFNMMDETFILYDVNDGLLSNELNKGAAMTDANGNIYFGGMFGFNVFSPDKIIQNMRTPQVVITTFSAHNNPTQYDLDLESKVILTYHQNEFSIRYAVLDYTNPQKNKYKHRLIGYDRDWVSTTSTHPFAAYSRVIPGRYEFQVIGSNNDGVWNTEPFTFTIIVKSPWFRHPLFILGVSVLLIIIITLLIRARINHIKNKHAVERQIFEMERQALRLQMNPHFIFNTLNSIQAFILKNKTKESISYLSKFSRLMRAILSNSQESIIGLDQELAMLNAYLELEQLRFDHRFEYEIIVSPGIDQEFIGVAPMLVQPYVENAVIHGVGPLKENKGKIRVEFKLDGKYLVCTISDNGVGRSYHQSKNSLRVGAHKSTGMNLTRGRLKLLDIDSPDKTHMDIVDLYDADNNAIGTKVLILILFEEI